MSYRHHSCTVETGMQTNHAEWQATQLSDECVSTPCSDTSRVCLKFEFSQFSFKLLAVSMLLLPAFRLEQHRLQPSDEAGAQCMHGLGPFQLAQHGHACCS